MGNTTVSVLEIEAGIDYIQTKFMNELISNGQEILKYYEEANNSLHSNTIDMLIQQQKVVLSNIQAEFETILQTARGNLENSSAMISTYQKSIDNALAQNINMNF